MLSRIFTCLTLAFILAFASVGCDVQFVNKPTDNAVVKNLKIIGDYKVEKGKGPLRDATVSIEPSGNKEFPYLINVNFNGPPKDEFLCQTYRFGDTDIAFVKFLKKNAPAKFLFAFSFKVSKDQIVAQKIDRAFFKNSPEVLNRIPHDKVLIDSESAKLDLFFKKHQNSKTLFDQKEPLIMRRTIKGQDGVNSIPSPANHSEQQIGSVSTPLKKRLDGGKMEQVEQEIELSPNQNMPPKFSSPGETVKAANNAAKKQDFDSWIKCLSDNSKPIMATRLLQIGLTMAESAMSSQDEMTQTAAMDIVNIINKHVDLKSVRDADRAAKTMENQEGFIVDIATAICKLIKRTDVFEYGKLENVMKDGDTATGKGVRKNGAEIPMMFVIEDGSWKIKIMSPSELKKSKAKQTKHSNN